MMFKNSKNFIGDNTIEGFDELARETVSNDNEFQDDIAPTDSSDFRKTWNVKYILRSHLDGVSCVAFHPVDSLVITGSEDRTLKLWNLEKSAILRKSASTTQDLEPIYTFRRHTGPVLCMAMHPSGEQFYSGGLDSIISVWNIPNSEVDPYDPYDSNVLLKVLTGHTDAVWQLVLSGQKLLSCSADGSVRLWDSNLSEPLQSTINYEGIPISIDWLMQNTNQFIVTYDTLKTIIYDTETGKILREISNDHSSTGDPNYRINRLISHPTQPIIITAHDDRKIRYFDSNSGRMIHSMVAHLESVTSVTIDPQQNCLLSSSHDRSIRLWDFETKKCLQELTAHQKKDDESVHDVIFHSSKPYMASVGADSVAKIYA
jgi:striatin 1/3/4